MKSASGPGDRSRHRVRIFLGHVDAPYGAMLIKPRRAGGTAVGALFHSAADTVPRQLIRAALARALVGPSACSQASEQAPDKFDNAVLLKICSDGTHVLRLNDGSVWADDYKVEDWRMVC